MISEGSESVRLLSTDLDTEIGQCRVAPVRVGGTTRLLLAHARTPNVDPYSELFFYPSDSVMLTLVDLSGAVVWKRQVAPATVPGIWFNPILPFDLDGDGDDEIWFVENVGDLPFSNRQWRLQRLRAADGAAMDSRPWTNEIAQWRRPSRLSLTFMFRFFLMGGYAGGEPVLVLGKGSYQDMYLQGCSPDMSVRWSYRIDEDDPGARGSHVTPILDINGDGVDELMWGERCIELDGGRELFCCDRDSYRGHSDLIQPLIGENGEVRVYTARETDEGVSPRVALFDDRGARLWGRLESGHMHTNYAARLAGHDNPIVVSVETGGAGQVFVADCMTGKPVDLSIEPSKVAPVDFDGDGFHEFLHHDGRVLRSDGTAVARVAGRDVFRGHVDNRWPGEQIGTVEEGGRFTLWGLNSAAESDRARRRYENPFYRSALRHHAVGYNLNIAAGV